TRLGLRVLAELGEEDQLEERRAQHRRDVHRRADPVEEPAIRDQAAHEKGAPPAPHVKARVARARERCSNQRKVKNETTIDATPSPSTAASGPQTPPPRAAWR